MNYSKLPEHMQNGARLYIEEGIEPGSFMWAVLCNDLVGAFGKADHINLECMKDWASWVYNDCPSLAWRTPQKVEAWIAHNGLSGIKDPRVGPVIGNPVDY